MNKMHNFKLVDFDTMKLIAECDSMFIAEIIKKQEKNKNLAVFERNKLTNKYNFKAII